ncbi:MAG: hypothetical protein CFE45_17365 [Burkholderiales bacterium PBB5]|nr:MAG: hypothetical protein CFE45_17365 [Burkholderiales bacterium PBB5]
MTAPSAASSTRLAAAPEAVWAQVSHSAFVARWLGACLPAANWHLGLRLVGQDAQGQTLTLWATEVAPPASLSLRVQGAQGSNSLCLSIAGCVGGSRLTVLQGPLTTEPQSHHGLAHRLAQPLPALLQASACSSAEALQTAIAYLADSAALVDALRQAMPAHAGYTQPAGDRFSLVQHLWHLADVEQFGWAQRFARLLVEVDPVLPGVDGDALAVERCYQQQPWRAAARRFVAQRRRTLAALKRCDADTLRRPVHFSGQPGTGAEMLAALLAHDHEHRTEMATLWPPADA